MAGEPQSHSPHDVSAIGLPVRLRRTRFGMAATMAVERFWPLIMPLLLIAGLFLIFAWSGLFRMMGDTVRISILLCFAAATVWSLIRLRYFRLPLTEEVDLRLERHNQLHHQPIGTQTDRLDEHSESDPFALALWREHQKRMAERIGALGTGLPESDIARRDPYALRTMVPLFLVVAFAFSFSEAGGRIADAFSARAEQSAAIPTRIDAWVTPPDYTGRAPVFLTAEQNRNETLFTVPRFSTVTVRVTGGETDIRWTPIGGAAEPLPPSDEGTKAGTAQYDYVLEGDGTLAIGGGQSGSFAFSVTPDRPPEVRFTEAPAEEATGALALKYRLTDDYGVASAQAIIETLDPPDPESRPLYEPPIIDLRIPPRRGDGSGETVKELIESPFAGMPVGVHILAEDAAGQSSMSRTAEIFLPKRRFTNPLALALLEQRQLLAMDADDKPYVQRLLRSTMMRPEETIPRLADYLALSTVVSRLDQAQTYDQLRAVVDYMWDVAIGIEDGNLSAAEKRLRDAQQALREAIERGASPDEIDSLMQELRTAMAEYMRELAENAARDPNRANQPPPDPDQMMTGEDLQDMLDRLEELAKNGDKEAAQQLLSMMEQMMQNMQAMQGQSGQQSAQGQMRQQMDRLGDIMRQQQKLLDETFRREQGEPQPGGQPQQNQQGQAQPGQGQPGESQPGQGQQPGEGSGQQPGQGQNGLVGQTLQDLQERQRQLQQDLGRLTDDLRGSGIEPGEGFGDAGEAMGRAGDDLGDEDGQGAVGNQGDALEAMRRGAQDMMNQMQAMQESQPGDQGGAGENGRARGTDDRDPLGRPRATRGPDFGDTTKVPEEIEAERARRILEEIRRRLGDRLSPELERQYLERLLEAR
nr:TIGR02302 family protein [Notoacmeibacter sp. MSK16QG-6]